MPLFKFRSHLSKVTADEDIDALDQEQTGITQEQPKNTKERSLFNSLPDEIVISIIVYGNANDLISFSTCNSRYLKLFFNQDIKKQLENKTRLGKERNYIQSKKIEDMENYVNDEKTVDFERIQILIWKPLVCFYFPRFEKALNIKNWMHVLRRRVQHIKHYGSSSFLPIQARKPTDPLYEGKSDDYFIEKCEFIYKCPLSFQSLPGESNTRFCNECGKNVYNAEDIETFKEYVAQGHCVSFGEMVYWEGEMAEFE